MYEGLRWALRMFAYPLILVLPVAAAIASVETGWARSLSSNPGLAELYAFIACILPAALAIAALERVIPYKPEWNQSKADIGTDTIHMVTGYTVQNLLKGLTVFVGIQIASALQSVIGIGLWPTSLPIVVQLILTIYIGELGHYSYHRLAHEHPLFWRLHATHHSAERLYWLNANRFHWLDIGLMSFIQTLPLVVLGVPEPVLFVYGVWSLVFGYTQHANCDFRATPLSYLLSTHHLHRYHHSPEPREGNTNYAGQVILWDQLFRSFYNPPEEFRREPGNGLPKFPKTFLAQQLSPFRWKEIEGAPAKPSETKPAEELRQAS